jgi:hypothetical protein
MAFAVMASQANAPEDDQTWGIWFGTLNHPKIKQRVTAVLEYLNALGVDLKF